MSLVSVTNISSLMVASVAEQASLSLTWSETPKDTFSHDEARLYSFPRLVSGAGCGIRLYRFLSIAFLSILHISECLEV